MKLFTSAFFLALFTVALSMPSANRVEVESEPYRPLYPLAWTVIDDALLGRLRGWVTKKIGELLPGLLFPLSPPFCRLFSDGVR